MSLTSLSDTNLTPELKAAVGAAFWEMAEKQAAASRKPLAEVYPEVCRKFPNILAFFGKSDRESAEVLRGRAAAAAQIEAYHNLEERIYAAGLGLDAEAQKLVEKGVPYATALVQVCEANPELCRLSQRRYVPAATLS